ncbi:heptaprenyl diphosphate synthase component II [Tepidibacillus decaturensis]|uniref:Heptaprenyl diphosphate synthase component 2 n=1 Tax=Tepidibacillus decaturensis TaxID=1413211 RepID=A0A135L3Z3_9BACI|nr:heptaprenyl diphosphate synthase component II [Tepidibacillus decaturensis]KXG43637.1 heptaprenyl diphosphate synthase [Tepidibacillus decaturensis]
MKLVDIYYRMKKDINEIEKELSRAITTDQGILNQSANHLLKAGGKRIRPVFVLLSGHFGEYDFDKLKKVAAALELIHMATLVHDDVIDDADKRRGKLTVKAQWDNKIAMYTGDYIFAEALMLITEFENPEIHQTLSNAIVRMCEGEIEQIKDFNNWNQSLKQYLRRIKRKTALLIAISCKLGGLASNADLKTVRRLYQYGYNVGMAFQIVDDILDFTGTTEQLGKPAGSDLRQGNITIPALYALHYSNDKEKLQRMVKSDHLQEQMDEMVDIVRKSEGIDYSKELAQTYIQKAKKALMELPNIKERKTLLEISDFIADRTY